MTFAKIGAAAAALSVSLALPAVCEARPLGTVDWTPFFGLPYPFGYVYHPPKLPCDDLRREYDPIEGYVWICGSEPPVRARY